jgi:hypothetical protein
MVSTKMPNNLKNTKKCITCKKTKPKTKEFWRFDKRREEPYGSCASCVNKRRSLQRNVERIGKYATSFRIKKTVKSKNISDNLIDAKRTQLILLNRIKNGENLVIDKNYLLCKICEKKERILLPISFKLLNLALKSFKKIHKHYDGVRHKIKNIKI